MLGDIIQPVTNMGFEVRCIFKKVHQSPSEWEPEQSRVLWSCAGPLLLFISSRHGKLSRGRRVEKRTERFHWKLLKDFLPTRQEARMTFVRGIQVSGARESWLCHFGWSGISAAIPPRLDLVLRCWQMRGEVCCGFSLRSLQLLTATLQTWSSLSGEWRVAVVKEFHLGCWHPPPNVQEAGGRQATGVQQKPEQGQLLTLMWKMGSTLRGLNEGAEPCSVLPEAASPKASNLPGTLVSPLTSSKLLAIRIRELITLRR